MEEVVLLEDLLGNEQIDWLVANLGTENDLYINNENSSSSPTLFDSLSQLSDPAHNNDSNHSSSPENSNEEESVNSEDNPNTKRKRRDSQNQSERKRRMKYADQLSTLRTLLWGQDANSKKTAFTRDTVMSSAITEIVKLRQELSQLKQPASPLIKVGTGKFPQLLDFSRFTIANPQNKSPYTNQDLERAFQTMLAREVEQCCYISGARNEQSIFYCVKMLKDLSKQIGKPEYQLSVGMLEQFFHSLLRFNPTEFRRMLEENWNLYQRVKRTDKDALLLFAEHEMGTWILMNMCGLEFLTGNIDAAERTYGFAKQLSKKIQYPATNRLLLAKVASTTRISIDTAKKINSILQSDHVVAPQGLMILGAALIENGKDREGLDAMETAWVQLLERKGEAALSLASPLIEAYIQTGHVDKGLSCTNYILNQKNLDIEGAMGTAELLRLRGNLVMLKKYPDYKPEIVTNRKNANVVDAAVEELINLCESVPNSTEHDFASTQRPAAYNLLHACLSTPPIVGNDDVAMILRSAMNLAHRGELYTIELRCAVDLTRYFLHIGDINQARDAVLLVKDCVSRMKGPEDSRELQRAHYVIALVECCQ